MIKQRPLTFAVAIAATLFGVNALARKPHHVAEQKAAATATSADAAKTSQPIGKLVEYAELEQRIGSEIVVETTLHTVRRGKLVKYSNPALTIQLGAEHGGVELTIPRETVRNVSIVLAPAVEEVEPAQQKSGTDSAKKN